MGVNKNIVAISTADPPAVANAIVQYSKLVLGVSELFARKSDGTILQLGAGGGGMSIGGAVTGGTVNSVLFVGAGGLLAQNNAAFSWTDSLKRLTITQSTADPADGGGAITIKNTLNTSLAQITWQNHTGTFQAALGRANTAVQGQLFWFFDSPTSAGLLFSSAGGSHMTIFAGVANGAGFQMHSGSSVVLSEASTGRMRYLPANVAFQFSVNGGAYFNVPVVAAALTTGSVPFANASGQLDQQNAFLFWDNTQHALLLYTDSAGSANGPLFVRSTVTTGPGAMGALSLSGAFKSYWGHYNSAYSFVYMRDKNGVLTDGSNIIFGNLTVPTHEFGMTAGSLFFEMFNGGSAAASSANAGRLRYNTTGQKSQLSHNAGGYFDVATYVAAITTGSIVFANASNQLAQDNANLFWDDTNNRLGIGTATPSAALSVSYGGTLHGGATATISSTSNTSPAVAATNASDTAGAMSVRNTNVNGPVDFYATDNGGTTRISWGYGNASYSDAARASRSYVWRNTGVDFVIARTGIVDVMYPSDGGIQIHASTSAVAAASTGRLRYTTTGQKTQLSHSTGAYFDVATYAAALTAGSIVFANASNQLAQDNANLFWDDTNNRLGIGNAAPAESLHVTNSSRFDATVNLSNIAAGGPVLNITATSDTPTVTWGVAAGNEVSTTPAGYLEIVVGGSPRYIPFWA